MCHVFKTNIPYNQNSAKILFVICVLFFFKGEPKQKRSALQYKADGNYYR